MLPCINVALHAVSADSGALKVTMKYGRSNMIDGKTEIYAMATPREVGFEEIETLG